MTPRLYPQLLPSKFRLAMIFPSCLLPSALCPLASNTSLFAVHLPDGNVLTSTWIIGGYLLAGILVVMGSWRLRDEEIPQVALLTAAFFVVSLIHVPVPGLPTSAH